MKLSKYIESLDSDVDLYVAITDSDIDSCYVFYYNLKAWREGHRRNADRCEVVGAYVPKRKTKGAAKKIGGVIIVNDEDYLKICDKHNELRGTDAFEKYAKSIENKCKWLSRCGKDLIL